MVYRNVGIPLAPSNVQLHVVVGSRLSAIASSARRRRQFFRAHLSQAASPPGYRPGYKVSFALFDTRSPLTHPADLEATWYEGLHVPLGIIFLRHILHELHVGGTVRRERVLIDVRVVEV